MTNSGKLCNFNLQWAAQQVLQTVVVDKGQNVNYVSSEPLYFCKNNETSG